MFLDRLGGIAAFAILVSPCFASVEFVVDLLGRGWTVEQILKEYNHLTREDIQACLAYAGEMLKSERVYLVPG